MPSRAVCKGVVVVVVVHRVCRVNHSCTPGLYRLGLDRLSWDYSRNAGREGLRFNVYPWEPITADPRYALK